MPFIREQKLLMLGYYSVAFVAQPQRLVAPAFFIVSALCLAFALQACFPWFSRPSPGHACRAFHFHVGSEGARDSSGHVG